MTAQPPPREDTAAERAARQAAREARRAEVAARREARRASWRAEIEAARAELQGARRAAPLTEEQQESPPEPESEPEPERQPEPEVRAEPQPEPEIRVEPQPVPTRRPASTEPALTGTHLTVCYRPFTEKQPSLRAHGFRAVKRHDTPVVAVDDVSLTVYRGEAYGIIGSNGAGKTTLLRVLAGVLPPDSGEVVVHGKQPPSMLALGAGFNRKLSGRRNIYLGGLAAGLRKAEIDEMFDDIVAYSELGDAIDRPTLTYSSGMFARLAFAVAIRRRPQILLIDEVFAVGDQSFKMKSTETMEGLLAEAGTIVMVSHGLSRMRRFCHRLAWMDRGRLVDVGEPEEIARRYLASVGLSPEQIGED